MEKHIQSVVSFLVGCDLCHISLLFGFRIDIFETMKCKLFAGRNLWLYVGISLCRFHCGNCHSWHSNLQNLGCDLLLIGT